jgi:hypothetical protein
MTVTVLKGIPGIGAMIVDTASAEKTCARHGKNVLKNIKLNAPKPPKVEAAAVLKAASLPPVNKPKKHGPSALRNIKPNAPKPPKAVEAEAHKVVEAAAAHSNGAPRVMTFAKPLPSASSNLPNPAKK